MSTKNESSSSISDVRSTSIEVENIKRKSTFYKSMTQNERQLLHPLEINDSVVPGTIMPFEVLFMGILSLIITQPLYGMMKFIPVKDKRTGQTKTWALGT